MRKSLLISLAILTVCSMAFAQTGTLAGSKYDGTYSAEEVDTTKLDMELLGSALHLWNELYCVKVEGNYAYIVGGPTGLAVVDVTNFGTYNEIGYCNTPGFSNWLDKSGDYVYIADMEAGVRVIDVSDPTAPVEVGSYEELTLTYDVEVNGDYLYVSDQVDGYHILDISDPTTPTFVGSVDTPGSSVRSYVVGDYAYVADLSNGLCIVNISDKSNPTVVTSCLTNGYARSVVVVDTLALVAQQTEGLAVISVADVNNPTVLGNCAIENGFTWDVAVKDTIVYIAAQEMGVRTISINDPSNPYIVGQSHSLGWSMGLDVCDDSSYVYVADTNVGLCALNVENAASPAEAIFYNNGGYTSQVLVKDDYAYVSLQKGGVAVLDVSDLENPTFVKKFTPGTSLGMAISGNYLLVAASDAGLQIYDISDPASESTMTAGFFFTFGSVIDVRAANGLIYVLDQTNGLYTLDPSFIMFPSQLANMPITIPGGLDVVGDYAYVTTLFDGLKVIDISQSDTLIAVGSCSIFGFASNVKVHDDIAYVSTGGSGMGIVDVSNPEEPTAITYFTGGKGGASDVVIVDSLAFIASTAGVDVVNIDDPENPELVGYYLTPGYSTGLAVDEDYNVFLGDGYYFQVLSYEKSEPISSIGNVANTGLPTKFEIASLYPNPFNPTLNAVVALPEAGHLSVVVYNALGQQISTLADQRFSAGNHVFTFDGHNLATGVYFVRAAMTGEANSVRKVVLLK